MRRHKKKDPLEEIRKDIQRFKFRLSEADREASWLDSDPEFAKVEPSDMG